MATLGVTVFVVDSQTVELGVGSSVDRVDLDRGVLDGLSHRDLVSNSRSLILWGSLTYQTLDNGVGHGVSIEELRLGLAAVGTLGIPPTSTIAVESSAGTIDSERISGDGNERTLPLLVAESGSTLENDMGSLGELSQVESRASRNNKAVQSNGRAGRLGARHGCGTRSAREGTGGGTLVESRRCSSCCGGQRHNGDRNEGTEHGETIVEAMRD